MCPLSPTGTVGILMPPATGPGSPPHTRHVSLAAEPTGRDAVRRVHPFTCQRDQEERA